MKLVFTFLLGLVLGACINVRPPASAHVPGRDYASASLEAKTVAIVSPGAVCSGVWVSKWSFVTADHCVDDRLVGETVAYAVKGDIYPGMALAEAEPVPSRQGLVSAHDHAHDLALVFAIAPPDHLVAEVRPDLPMQGAFAQTMGHPLGLWFSYSTGDIAAIREKEIGDDRSRIWIQCTAPISPGSSGGGLFDAEGRLVGIAAAVAGLSSHGQALNLFTPSGYVASMLSHQKGGY